MLCIFVILNLFFFFQFFIFVVFFELSRFIFKPCTPTFQNPWRLHHLPLNRFHLLIISIRKLFFFFFPFLEVPSVTKRLKKALELACLAALARRNWLFPAFLFASLCLSKDNLSQRPCRDVVSGSIAAQSEQQRGRDLARAGLQSTRQPAQCPPSIPQCPQSPCEEPGAGCMALGAGTSALAQAGPAGRFQAREMFFSLVMLLGKYLLPNRCAV